ncbi:hypothetical protein DENSPDRAFT_508011 [Dentipellis sp. KUC8613]|nr:hypothetical protein DENSPDRAFT_508011 [Dentipellis sp. KUC8613]
MLDIKWPRPEHLTKETSRQDERTQRPCAPIHRRTTSLTARVPRPAHPHTSQPYHDATAKHVQHGCAPPLALHADLYRPAPSQNSPQPQDSHSYSELSPLRTRRRTSALRGAVLWHLQIAGAFRGCQAACCSGIRARCLGIARLTKALSVRSTD